MKKKFLLTAGVSLMLGMAALLGGCQGKNDDSNTNIEEKQKEEVLKNIGMESDGENVYKVVLENKTGKGIVGFSIKDSSMTEFPENMLEENDIFENDEKRNLFYDAASAVEAAENQETGEDGSAKVLNPQMDIQLTFEDQTSLILTAFPFGDVEEAQICLEDEVAFVQYESLSSEELVSTKEAELRIKTEAEAAAQAQAEAEAAAAAQAQAEAEAAAAAQAQAEAEAAAAAQAQAEAEAAAAAQAQAEAEAAAAAERQQQEAQQSQDNLGAGCVNDGLVY